jgi:hypothetical protein
MAVETDGSDSFFVTGAYCPVALHAAFILFLERR